jgi:hypothetical protein
MATQPPQELFCMNCGPGVAVERRDGAVLRCPRCGDEQQVPDLPLFVVTGASGIGKSTVTGPLRRQLPDCEIFDTDALLHVAALGLDTYRARSSASPTTSRSTAA